MGPQKLTLYNDMKLLHGKYSNAKSVASPCSNTKVDTTVESRLLRCVAILLDEWLLTFWKILAAYLHRGQAVHSSWTTYPWRRRQKLTVDNYSPYVTCRRTQVLHNNAVRTTNLALYILVWQTSWFHAQVHNYTNPSLNKQNSFQNFLLIGKNSYKWWWMAIII